jgi:hypothetical protein
MTEEHAGKRWHLRVRIIVCLCYALSAIGVSAVAESQQDSITLVLPRVAAPTEAVWLQIRAGLLPRGARLRVSTSDGVLLGTVAPFGVPRGQEGGMYTVPLPQTAVVNGRVQLHLEVEEPGAIARAPKSGEVEDIALIYVPVTK